MWPNIKFFQLFFCVGILFLFFAENLISGTNFFFIMQLNSIRELYSWKLDEQGSIAWDPTCTKLWPESHKCTIRANVLLITYPKTSNQELFFYLKVCRIELGPNKAIENWSFGGAKNKKMMVVRCITKKKFEKTKINLAVKYQFLWIRSIWMTGYLTGLFFHYFNCLWWSRGVTRRPYMQQKWHKIGKIHLHPKSFLIPLQLT